MPEAGDPTGVCSCAKTLHYAMDWACSGKPRPAMLLWLAVLQNIPVGIAYPMLSLNFVWVTLAAWKIWREPVTTRHWLGVGLIITGIFILGSAV